MSSFGEYTDSDGLYFNNEKNLLAVANGSSVLLMECYENGLKLKILSEFKLSAEFDGTTESVFITYNSLWVISTVRTFGLIVL